MEPPLYGLGAVTLTVRSSIKLTVIVRGPRSGVSGSRYHMQLVGMLAMGQNWLLVQKIQAVKVNLPHIYSP